MRDKNKLKTTCSECSMKKKTIDKEYKIQAVDLSLPEDKLISSLVKEHGLVYDFPYH
jgi:transposase-like protein